MVKGIIRNHANLTTPMPTKTKLKVGDKVKVREDLRNSNTGIPEDFLERVRGKYVEIYSVSDSPNDDGDYTCKIKEAKIWSWSDKWFER